jgi:transcriptional regulator with XRE-family HTH domain
MQLYPIDTALMRQTRLAQGLTHRGLAAKCSVLVGKKVDHGNIGRIERGETRPRPETLKYVADALGLQVTDLLEKEAA